MIRSLSETTLKAQASSSSSPISSSSSLLLSQQYAVICGDCTQAQTYQQFQRVYKKKKADILVTDPPYCLLERKRVNGQKRDTKAVHKRNKIDEAAEVPRYQTLAEYRQFTEQWLSTAITQGLEKGAPLIIWSNLLGKRIIVDVCKQLNYHYIGEFLWAKPSVTPSSSGTSSLPSTNQGEFLLRLYEVALIFQPKDAIERYKAQTGSKTNSEDHVLIRGDMSMPRYKLPWSVISGYHDTMNGMSVLHKHPCHKPLASILPLLHIWSKPGDIILDPFAGSGGIAQAVKAIGEDRTYRGIEILESWSKETQSTLLNKI